MTLLVNRTDFVLATASIPYNAVINHYSAETQGKPNAMVGIG